MIKIEKLNPFGRMCISLGMLPSSYKESLTYEEQLLWFMNYLENTVIPTVNNNADAVEELQTLFTELQSYVDNYFQNINVQEEINNKLDEMAEDGTLTTLIKNYIDPLYQSYEEEINAEIDSFKNNVNETLNSYDTRIQSLASGSPLVASSTSEMLDTTRTYVNTSNGKWYYYDGDSWEIGGDYQSTGIADNSITLAKLSYEFKIDSDNMLDSDNALENKVWKTNQPVTSDQTTTNNLYESFNAIPVSPGDVLIPLYENGDVYDHNLDQVLYYNEDGSYNSYALIQPSNFPITIPADIYYIKITIQKAYHLSQIKLYDSGNYNPKYQPYKYVSLIVMKNDISYLDKFGDVNTNFNSNSYILADPTSSDVGKALTNAYSSTFSSSDYIPVIPGNTIKLSGIYAVSNSGACAYNGNKEYVETIIYNSSSKEVTYNVPSNVYFIRFTIKTSDLNNVYGKYSNIKYSDLINPLNKIELNLNNICNNYANKPVLTLIDDDCNTSSITTIKTICDSNNVKCSFACITKNLDSSLINTLKSYQEEGYHITSHTNEHDRWYKNTIDGDMFTLDECESDLIKSLVKLKENIFLDSDYIVAPGSSYSREGIDSIINKWAKCFVANSYDATYNKLYTPDQFKINRTMINSSLHDLQFYKNWINSAYDNNNWIILGSHSYNTSEFDSSLYESIIQYAINKGFEVKTLNEAFKERKLIYEVNDLLS